MQRYGIFVHNPDGDMGYGEIVGAMSSDAADKKAEAIRRAAERQGLTVECVIVPVSPGSVSAKSLVRKVQ